MSKLKKFIRPIVTFDDLLHGTNEGKVGGITFDELDKVSEHNQKSAKKKQAKANNKNIKKGK